MPMYELGQLALTNHQVIGFVPIKPAIGESNFGASRAKLTEASAAKTLWLAPSKLRIRGH
jgi:hypothetical protein